MSARGGLEHEGSRQPFHVGPLPSWLRRWARYKEAAPVVELARVLTSLAARPVMQMPTPPPDEGDWTAALPQTGHVRFLPPHGLGGDQAGPAGVVGRDAARHGDWCWPTPRRRVCGRGPSPT